MSRKVDEWVGKTDDTPPPPRVKLRIVERQKGCCEFCGRAFNEKCRPEFDHRPALINGGENRETRIFAVCHECHSERTKQDVAEKSYVAGIKKDKLKLTNKKPWPKRRDPWGREYRAKQERQA